MLHFLHSGGEPDPSRGRVGRIRCRGRFIPPRPHASSGATSALQAVPVERTDGPVEGWHDFGLHASLTEP